MKKPDPIPSELAMKELAPILGLPDLCGRTVIVLEPGKPTIIECTFQPALPEAENVRVRDEDPDGIDIEETL